MLNENITIQCHRNPPFRLNRVLMSCQYKQFYWKQHAYIYIPWYTQKSKTSINIDDHFDCQNNIYICFVQKFINLNVWLSGHFCYFCMWNNSGSMLGWHLIIYAGLFSIQKLGWECWVDLTQLGLIIVHSRWFGNADVKETQTVLCVRRYFTYPCSRHLWQ